MDDPTVESLRALCAATGGHKALGQIVGANPQTIHQIIQGVKLPSGKPRGVGRELREKIDSKFPGWLKVKPGEMVFPPSVADAMELLTKLAELLAQNSPTQRAVIAGLLSGLAGEPTNMVYVKTLAGLLEAQIRPTPEQAARNMAALDAATVESVDIHPERIKR